MSKKRPNPLDYTFGGPEYLKAKFDDIDEAVVSKKSKAFYAPSKKSFSNSQP